MGTHSLRFEAVLQARQGRLIAQLPELASRKLPSRGQVAVQGTMNGHAFKTVIEPDGEFGHWINVTPKLKKAARLAAGTEATIEVEPMAEWPEPSVPADLREALDGAAPKIQNLWDAITPMARWEWVRWVSATKNPATRGKRVEVSLSKLSKGMRRPCCFNLASCTDPELSKNGKLIDE